MISQKVIDSIYKKYNKRPKSTDDLNVPLLFESIDPAHGVEIDGDILRINSISPDSPFHELMLRMVHAIVELHEHVAIVLHSSIIFLNKEGDAVNIHIKPINQTFTQRLASMFSH